MITEYVCDVYVWAYAFSFKQYSPMVYLLKLKRNNNHSEGVAAFTLHSLIEYSRNAVVA